MSSCCRGTGHLCRLVVVPVSRHRRSCRRWRAAVALATHVILSLSSDRGPQSKYCNWTGRERDNGDGTVNNGNTSQQGAASWRHWSAQIVQTVKQRGTSLCRLGHPSNPQGVRSVSSDRRQHGRIKFEAAKGSEARERDMTYLG
ncbi:hypothetical protein SCLCIDRAFT_437957 [Scleroderma citrinum Foug A]|uniref:Uncharacterized protein n=1 Tax=Scleroderma citrinum Foug A TaxID=1036808 RepID=A0A0C2ZL68_9AGAM|nr:hypothetical protein SCLCIDRAFT_437957 [Scleroderma citrinum Foug A]